MFHVCNNEGEGSLPRRPVEEKRKSEVYASLLLATRNKRHVMHCPIGKPCRANEMPVSMKCHWSNEQLSVGEYSVLQFGHVFFAHFTRHFLCMGAYGRVCIMSAYCGHNVCPSTWQQVCMGINPLGSSSSWHIRHAGCVL